MPLMAYTAKDGSICLGFLTEVAKFGKLNYNNFNAMAAQASASASALWWFSML